VKLYAPSYEAYARNARWLLQELDRGLRYLEEGEAASRILEEGRRAAYNLSAYAGQLEKAAADEWRRQDARERRRAS
jgi:hypothetical protein